MLSKPKHTRLRVGQPRNWLRWYLDKYYPSLKGQLRWNSKRARTLSMAYGLDPSFQCVVNTYLSMCLSRLLYGPCSLNIYSKVISSRRILVRISICGNVAVWLFSFDMSGDPLSCPVI